MQQPTRLKTMLGAMPVDVQVDATIQLGDFETSTITKAWTALCAELKHPSLDHAVCIRLCSAAESRLLNAEYRGKDKPTNVLSFTADLPAELEILGDLAICWDVVVDEARSQGKAIADHISHLVVHGLLHLLGYDHEQDDAAQNMEALEKRVLARLDIADPYRDEG